MLTKKFLLILFLSVSVQLFCTFSLFAEEVDHSLYETLLKKYVSRGKVDYLEWKKNDFEIFEEYIESLKDIAIENMEEDERKVFWINTYNALTVYAVLKRIPANSLLARIFSVQMISGFFDEIEYDIAGESLTLNDIENEKLRKGFNDPRSHFVIVCASRSCPALQVEIFEAKGLDKRLDKATKLFIQDTTRNRLDKKKNILYLSQIFKWYVQDFIDRSGSIVNYLKRYLLKEDTEYLSSHEVQIEYLYYDWLVNIK